MLSKNETISPEGPQPPFLLKIQDPQGPQSLNTSLPSAG